MATTIVGSVTAELLLNTGNFTEQITNVRNQVNELNKAFMGSDAKAMAEQIDKLEKQLQQSSNVIKEQSELIEKLKEDYEKLSQEFSKVSEESNKVVKANENIVKSNKKVVSSTKEVNKTSINASNTVPNTSAIDRYIDKLVKAKLEVKRATELFSSLGYSLAGQSQFWVKEIEVMARWESQLQKVIATARAGATAVKNFHSQMNMVNQLTGKFGANSQFNAITSLQAQINGFGANLEGLKDWDSEVGKTTSVMSKFYEMNAQTVAMLKETDIQLQLTTGAFRTLQAQINSFGGNLEFSNGIKDWNSEVGKSTSIMSKFYEINHHVVTELANQWNQLTETARKSNEVLKQMGDVGKTAFEEIVANAQRGVEGVAKFHAEVQKNIQSLEATQQRIQQFSESYGFVGQFFERMDAELRKASEEIAVFEKRFMQMESALKQGMKFTLLEDLVPANMQGELNRIKELMAQISAEEEKLAQKTSKAKSQMNSMTGATNKLKQGMSSLKMVLSTVSSMFIWTFGMSLWEATKQTVTSKNEMESYLHQMGMSRGSISVFNRGLDETVEKFRKLNKYMVGETIAGIGMEFDLTARQMTKAMDVVAMIQNEYVRAGRKEEEATLAVKDILQGEFLRLSRETGVGKQDLIDTGLWSGDLKDIEGLMEALRKVGTDRHWDLFAQKCTSLSDVVSTAKNRISEFTATLIDQVSPLIVGGFNGLIDVVDFLTNSWNNMGSSMQALVGGGLLTGLATAILMIGKNMGLVQIATNGFTNSLASMILKMDASQVKSQGLIKSIVMTVTGFKSEEVAGMGTVKMLTARILGLDTNIIKTHNFATAIKVAKEGLVGEDAVNRANILGKQKMITVLKESVISWKALKIAIMGVMALGIIAFLGAVAQACERAKQSVDTFYEVVDNGKELIEDAQKTYESYGEQIGKINERMEKAGAGTKTYNRLQDEKERLIRNQSQAYTNLQNIQMAQQKAEKYNTEQQQRLNNINLDQQDRLTKVYEKRGLAHDEATEKASKYLSEVELANRIINESYDAYEDSLTSATGHMDAHVQSLKDAGASEEQMNKYMEDYMAESYKVAEYWKEFKQGDFWAIFKIGLGELTKAWIDIANHPEVIKLMNGLGQTFKEMKPYIDGIVQGLQTLGMYLVQVGNWLLSNPLGRQVAGWGALGLVIGGVGLKIAGIISGGKGMKEMFMTLASKVIPKLKDKLKDLTTTAEETGTVLGGGSSKDGKGKDKGKGKGKDKGTGGVLDTSPTYTDWSKTSLKEVVKSDFYDNIRSTVKMMTYLAEAMVLVTEAIILIQAPMWALANTGEYFKTIEPQIKKGVEGLQTIAPVLGMLLPPIVALMVLMEKFGDGLSATGIAKTGLKLAVGIAVGLGLVAETILMIVPSVIALGVVGMTAEAMGDSPQKGMEAMKLVGEALTHLASAVPFLIAGVILGIAMFESGGIGGILTLAVAGGIMVGMLLCAETVLMMEAPLLAISQLGNWNVDLGAVRQGAEAIKVCGEALKYLDEASSSMVDIAWDNLVAWILSGGNGMKDVANSLSEDNGLINSLNDFAEKFSTLEFKEIDTGKVESLKTLATSVSTIGEAIKTVQESLSTFSNELSPSERYAQATGNDVQAGFDGLQSIYDEFENMKTIIGKMSDFAKEINEMEITPINEGIASAITTTANSINQVKTAVDSVKNIMGGIVDANWTSNMASGGVFGAVMGYLGGNSGTGDYVSSFGSSLQSLENSVKDIMTFNNHIQSIVGSGNGAEGGDSSGVIANAVSVVQEIANVISQIKSTLSSGIQEIESTAKSMGKAIMDGISSGINEGMGNLEGNIKSKANSVGKATADEFKKGIDPMSDYMSAECDYIGQAIDNKHDGLVAKAGQLAKDMTDAFKSNLEMASPGKMARLIRDEMGYIMGFVVENTDPIVATIGTLAKEMTENFAPSLETQVDVNFTTGDVLSTYQSDSVEAMALANETVTTTEMAFGQLDYTTGLTFANIGNTIGTTMTNIANNTKNNYTTIANTTKTQLNNMQSQTTKNIGAIKQSWMGMQTALIQSAEHIRSETGAKIQSLQNNMATFWRKVQNPALLLGGGTPSEERAIKPRRYGSRGASVRKVLTPKGNQFAGSPSRGSKHRYASPLKLAPNSRLQGKTSISADDVDNILSGWKDWKYDSSTRFNVIFEYLKCLFNDGDCVAGNKHYAGGWDFDWTDEIKQAMLTWHTHFGEIYDPYLYVGKFENDDFPIRGIAPIAKNYIYDAISRTQYEFYWNGKYGDPLSIWNAGHFNCWDGAILVMALARALGFPNSHMVHGTWGGLGHVWAYVEGLGNIDATAIQNGYGLTAPSRTGVAGSKPRFKHNKAPTSDDSGSGDIHINIDMSGATVTDDSIGERIGRKVRDEIIDLINPSTSTGY